MIKTVENRVWAFDMEWVPDPLAGRLLYDIDESMTEPREILELMWGEGGATEEDPTPFLKLVKCRVVSIAALERRVRPDGQVALNLLSLPRDPARAEETSEASVISRFLEAVGQHKPQLVGFNSMQSDLKILAQRAVIQGVRAPGFCERPNKPWEGVDYFARGSDWNLDLKDMLSGWGKGVPSLHEIAVQCGIPGKMEVDGNQVAQLWLANDLKRIVEYNEYDALTTYLVWLRVAHFSGHFTNEEYGVEQRRVRRLLESRANEPDGEHMLRYIEEWDRLRRLVRDERARS